MNDLARLVEGLVVYRDKITVAIDAVAALLPPKAATNGANGKRPRLTDEQRTAIRKALATEKIGAVCERFGVSYPTVKKIRDEMGSAPSAPPPARSRAEARRRSGAPLQLLRAGRHPPETMRPLQEGSGLMIRAAA